MKKEAIILLSIFLLTFTIATPSINFQNEKIQEDETILGTISTTGEFTDKINREDIEFFEGRRPTSFEFDIFSYNGTYFFYVYANREGNFSIKINNVLYKEEGILGSINLEKEFEILTEKEIVEEEINESGNITFQNKTLTKILQIKPGALFITEDSKINLINKGNSEIEIKYLDEESVILPSELKEINISPVEGIQYLNITSYKNFAIPIISFLNGAEEELLQELRLDKNLIHMNLISGEEKIENLTLFNFVEENITEIEISSNLKILEIEDIDNLEAKTDKTIQLFFNAEEEGYLEGILIIEYRVNEIERNITIPLNLYILSEGSSTEDFERVEETCPERGGISCASNERCNGEPTFTSDGKYCCIGTCEEVTGSPYISEKKKSKWGWLIGLIILASLGLGGFFAYKKYKKTKPQKPEDKIEETKKIYEKRLKGGISRS